MTRRDWLGWLDIVAAEQGRARRSRRRSATDVRREGFSPCAAARHGRIEPRSRGACAETFGRQPGHPELLVLEFDRSRADPRFERRIDPARTLFIVSSKSGTTLEPNILQAAISSPASARRSAAERAGGTSSPSPIPAPSCRRRPSACGFRRRILRRSRASAGAIRCCRISAWCRPPRWASISRRLLDATPSAWCAPALPACRRRTIRACVLGAILGVAAQGRARQGDDHRPRPASPISAPGWSSCSRNRPASRARGSSRSMARRWGRPTSTARTGCSSICGSPASADDGAGRAALAALERAGHPVRAHQRRRPLPPRPGILPLGDRDRGRRRGASASIRSTSPTSRRARSRRAS